jgi:hypothetical protein
MNASEQWSAVYLVGLIAIALTVDLATGWRLVLAWSVVCPILWWLGEKSPFARRWKQAHRNRYVE